MAMQTAGVPTNPETIVPSLLVPRVKGRRTGMGAFAQWAPPGGLMPTESGSSGEREVPTLYIDRCHHPTAASPRGQQMVGQSNPGLDSLIAAVLSQGPPLEQRREANGNRLSPVRDFPKSPALVSPQFRAEGIHSPTGGLKPEVLRMLLSKPFSRPLMVQTNQAVQPITTGQSPSKESQDPRALLSSLATPKPVSRSGSNPRLPLKKRVQSTSSLSPAVLDTKADTVQVPASTSVPGVNSPSLPETRPSLSISSLETDLKTGVPRADSGTSSQSVSPTTKRRTSLLNTRPVNELLEATAEVVLGTKPAVDLKRDEADVLKTMLAAKEKELEAARRERDAIQLMACATKALLERKEEAIEFLKRRVAALESGAQITTENEDIALAALTNLHAQVVSPPVVSPFVVARKPRTPSVLLSGNEMQRIRSFSSLRTSEAKPVSSESTRTEGGSWANQTLPAGSRGVEEPQQASKGIAERETSHADKFVGRMDKINGPQRRTNSAGKMDVLAALMGLQELAPTKAQSQANGEGKAPTHAESVARAPGDNAPRKRKLSECDLLSPVEEGMASPILLRLPVSPFGRQRQKAATSVDEMDDATDSEPPTSPLSCPVVSSGRSKLQPGTHTVCIGSKLMPRIRASYTFVVDELGRKSKEKDSVRIVCTNHCPSGSNSFASLSAFAKRHGDGLGKSWRRKLVLVDKQGQLGGSLSRFLNALDEE